MVLAARDQVLRRVGKDAIGKLVVYSSDQTHSALQKACKVEFSFYSQTRMSYSMVEIDFHSGPTEYINICLVELLELLFTY